MKADPFVQARLLELQALDTRLQQIDHARGRVPQIAALAEAGGRLQQVSDDVVRVETGLSDIRREVDRAEADVQQVRDRAARDQARLDAGTGMTSRDLTSLQHELETLARRQSALEEVEIEVMERQESAEARLAELTASRDEAQAEVDRLTAERDAAIAELDAERTEVVRPRADLAGGIDDKLLALYDRIRDSSGGLGAAEFTHGRCGGCRLELNPVDVSAIERAASDEVVRCEECGRILVRTHSGD
ncbi:C4-type zinc ribbon domain-containing protein [Janibacter sp. CX7]|uniref:zinc ribbon domain-containing protein n=1 Tax=unclassified Janibacter TaxID=2649294 RepID=UPI0020CC8857|nr:C4-type zinc ribbon domain-containing protein [Janibacter sp. CX7]UTT64932.1 C4-type zinc ribbon domain-containing protein [Janibacter sp. CX7]